MIFFDEQKFIKREKDEIYLISKSINWGVVCDYSESEDLVEIEEPSGERTWIPISLFFYDRPLKKGLYIGLLRNGRVYTHIVKSLTPKRNGKKCVIYANLEYTGLNRELTNDDLPLKKLFHSLPTPTPTKPV